MIELTFKGEHLLEVRVAMENFLRDIHPALQPTPAPPPKAEAAKPEKKPEPKPDAAERMAKARAAKAKKKPEPAKPTIAPEVMQEAKAQQPEKFEDMVLEPDPTEELEPEPDPTKLAALRVKTTEDLQAAYSSGKHKQVLALLSKYGNGAKSFRELQINDFIPIRKAIDEGALA